MRKILSYTVVLLAVTATAAFAVGREAQGMDLSIGLSHGTGEYAMPDKASGLGYLYPGALFGNLIGGNMGEIGFNADLRKMLSADYGIAIGYDMRWGSTKAEPTTAATPGSPTAKITSSSWKIRLGGDRVGNIGDRFKWYFGPGLEYKSGKAKFEDFFGAPNTSIKGEPTNGWGINGRMGGVMMINPKTGIYGQIGDTFGSASVKDNGGKTTWYYSSFEAAWGLQFALGGK